LRFGANEQTRFNLSEAISRLANIVHDDPTIAIQLGASVGTVRSIRREYKMPAVERRWLRDHTQEAAETTAEDASSTDRAVLHRRAARPYGRVDRPGELVID
jgi:hypothetical protein